MFSGSIHTKDRTATGCDEIALRNQINVMAVVEKLTITIAGDVRIFETGVVLAAHTASE